MIKSIYKKFLASDQQISTDTRKNVSGSIFFALSGENFDGNQYALRAIEKGADYAVISNKKYQISNQFILVDDTLDCLQALAKYHRSKLDIPIIGITGSNGKTTTKELMASVLGKKYSVCATAGNFNNHIGVPLTILTIRHSHEIAIIEMGANHVGEIELLSEISSPTHGLITNIGMAHLEGFGGIEFVIRAKNEIYVSIKKNLGTLFYSLDEKFLSDLIDEYSPTVSFSCQQNCKADYCFELSAGPFAAGKLMQLKEEFIIETSLIGEHNFKNVMAAISVGLHFGITPGQALEAVKEYTPTNNRSQILHWGNNTLIMDAYNANPDSMNQAILSFHAIDAEKKVLILGDMLELGPTSLTHHLDLVDFLATLEWEDVYLVGPNFKNVIHSYISFETWQEAKSVIMSKEYSHTWFLIKGSRGITLEKIFEDL